MTLLLVLPATAALFYATVFLKSRSNVKWCAICLAVSLTWVGLLVARETEWFTNDVLLALLMGESVVGGYYLLDREVKKELLIFRLPALLTLTLVAYVMVTKTMHLPTLLFIGVIWTIHTSLYVYRQNPRVKTKMDHLIACCSRW